MVVLHLVLQRDQGPDGVEQWQATGLVDDQLQVSHKDSHIHGLVVHPQHVIEIVLLCIIFNQKIHLENPRAEL